MAPSFFMTDNYLNISGHATFTCASDPFTPTTITITTSDLWESGSGQYAGIIDRKPSESKKERIARVAKERMFASWDVHNKKTETIKEKIQICKPRHKVNHMGRRY